MLTVILFWAGLALQVVGVSMAFIGIATNHREYKAPDEKWILDWAVTLGRWIKTRAGVLGMRIRYLFTGKGNSGTIHAVTGTVELMGIGSIATAQITYGPIPEDVTLEERLALLEQRTRQDHDTINRLEMNALADRSKAEQLRIDFENRMVELRAEAEKAVGRLATSGVRLATWGLLITVIGMVLSAAAQPPTL